MTGATMFSGIAAPEVALPEVEWKWCAEIDSFCSAVLKYRHPSIPNLGDITDETFTEQTREFGAVDLVVAGSPCQDFSVAGRRAGMAGERGSLAIRFLELVGQIRPRWLLFENVPGMLSSTSHDSPDPRLPAHLGEGEEWKDSDEYRSEEGSNFGAFLTQVSELGYHLSWTSLDAQYFRLAQRRERLFVVGYFGDWRPAAAVLFDAESLSGNPAPSREARQNVAGTIGGSSQSDGFRTTDLDNNGAWIVSPTLNSGGHSKNPLDEPLTVDAIPILEAGARTGISTDDPACGIGIGSEDDPMFTLQRGKQHAVAFRAAGQERFQPREIAPPIAHSDGGGSGVPTVAFNLRGRDGGAMPETPELASVRSSSGGSSRSYVSQMAVRRLTPVECERLQGFPDNYTNVPYRGKPVSKDGPRYRSLGNSMAVPVIRWIGKRILEVDSMIQEER